jgi:glycosyltransferase involved in cell wall biosynthesis
MTKPNVLYISPSLTVKGGISSLISSYLRSDLAQRYSLHTVYSHVSGTKPVKALQAVKGLVLVAVTLAFKNIDIVHFHGGGCISALRKYVYFRLVKLFHCKVIFHLHGGAFPEQYKSLSPTLKSLITSMFEQVDLVICLSDHFRDEIKAIAPRATVMVQANSVVLPQEGKKHGVADDVRVVFLGLINEKKGFFDLLHVMARICREYDRVRLVIGGVGETERMHRMAAQLGIAGHIDYLGWLEPNERDLLLSTADILVLPSYGEGMPMAILEAMSFGVPVVATRVGGIPDLIADGENGFLVEAGDLDQLRARLAALISDHRLRAGMGAKGRQLVEDRYSFDAGIKNMDRIYDSLIGARKVSRERGRACGL